jgi:hypothetical protein
LAWALWTLVVLGLTVIPWLNQLARHAGRSDLGSDATTVVYGLVAVSAATVGAVVASRRSRHPVGWLLLALGLWFIYGYATWVLLAWRGAPPAVGLAVLDANVVVIPALIGFILLLTPTGALPSLGWRWWARVAAAAPLVGLVSLAMGPFRHSDQAVANPLAIDALAGPLLTMLLGLGYAGVVLGLGRLLPEGSSLVVAGATLAVAGVFQPARRRIQALVDRRFNRRRHDAAQTIQAFSTRLRDQVDLDTLTAEVLAVVDQTMQPTRASLWLRPPRESAAPVGASHRS